MVAYTYGHRIGDLWSLVDICRRFWCRSLHIHLVLIATLVINQVHPVRCVATIWRNAGAKHVGARTCDLSEMISGYSGSSEQSAILVAD